MKPLPRPIGADATSEAEGPMAEGRASLMRNCKTIGGRVPGVCCPVSRRILIADGIACAFL